MKNVQLLLVAMSLSLGVLAQAPQLHRNQNFSDSRPVDILTLDPSLERSLTLNNVNINPIQADIQALLLANDLAIYDIKSFVCRN
ncbi:MAG: hypothetical protein VXX18_00940, partial [Bacteroidota bacterium]|nr:hypothetical protein [Bacteroidota bacterium]